tara:strand:+ start:8778 stop:9119 length:342 start_codon:yes stop_codon:yes gene_type:complete
MNKTVIDFSVVPNEYDPLTNPTAIKVTASQVEMTSEEIAARKAEEAADGTDEQRDMRSLREVRNKKLAETDWTQGSDVPDAIKNAYTAYRQALRDITKTHNNPRTVVWPDKPE